MTSQQILSSLQAAGSENIKKILLKHGAREPIYGVKVEDMKKIMKSIKENRQQLAMELYASGVGDAMYMAGLMANGALMSEKELQQWVRTANSPALSEYTVPWVTSEHPKGFDIALEWIGSEKASVAASGWNTISCILSTKPDNELDLPAIKKLMTQVEQNIHKANDRIRYVMNGFIIAAGSYVTGLTEKALEAGKKIGTVTVIMEGTDCKVPSIAAYIGKVKEKGNLGKKKKTAKC